MHVTIETSIDDETIEQFLELYRAAFAPLAPLAAGRQSFHDEEFMEILADQRVLKVLAWDSGDQPCALSFLATELSLIPWISPAYFAARFPEPFARQAVYYCGTILVHPSHQRGPSAGMVLDAMCERIQRDRAVVAFDCCGFNVDVIRLPEIVAAAGRRLTALDTFEIDVQRYYAYAEVGVIEPERTEGFRALDGVIDLREQVPAAGDGA